MHTPDSAYLIITCVAVGLSFFFCFSFRVEYNHARRENNFMNCLFMFSSANIVVTTSYIAEALRYMKKMQDFERKDNLPKFTRMLNAYYDRALLPGSVIPDSFVCDQIDLISDGSHDEAVVAAFLQSLQSRLKSYCSDGNSFAVILEQYKKAVYDEDVFTEECIYNALADHQETLSSARDHVIVERDVPEIASSLLIEE